MLVALYCVFFASCSFLQVISDIVGLPNYPRFQGWSACTSKEAEGIHLMAVSSWNRGSEEKPFCILWTLCWSPWLSHPMSLFFSYSWCCESALQLTSRIISWVFSVMQVIFFTEKFFFLFLSTFVRLSFPFPQILSLFFTFLPRSPRQIFEKRDLSRFSFSQIQD